MKPSANQSNVRSRSSWSIPSAIALGLAAVLLVGSSVMAQETAPATDPAVDPTTQPATQSATAPSPETAPATAPSATTQPVGVQLQPPAMRPSEPGAPLVLNFKDAPLRSVLEYLSEAAGMIVVIQDAPMDGRVTIVSKQEISLDEALSLLDTVLKPKGCCTVRNGRTLKIVTLEQARKEFVPVRAGNDPKTVEPTDRVITQIIPIRSADAVKLKADLTSLIPSGADVTTNASSNTIIVTGSEATVRRLIEIIAAIDTADVSQVKVFQLKNANATNAAKLITDIFNDQTASAQNQRGGGRMGFPIMIGGMGGPQGQNGTSGRNTKVLASADDRTNTLVVSASSDAMKVIESMVEKLDSDPSDPQAVFVYRLKNAQAVNLESVLNNTFGTGSGSSYSSGSQNRQTGTQGRLGSSSGFGGSGGNSGRGFSGGGNSGRSGGGGQSFGSGGRTNNSTAGRTGGSSGYRGGAAGGRTQVAGGGTYADLVGQVYVVADPDTNSLLVTTASKNFERVKAIIADLDKAVPQVLIKVLIAEVTHDNSLDLGAEFSGFDLRASGKGFDVGTDFGVSAAKGGFTAKIDEANVSAAIHALATAGKLDVLSRPYILTSDNQEASIMVGQEVPIITQSYLTADGQTINSIEYNDVGIILDVTPHINPQGLVTLDVYPEISELSSQSVPISSTVSAPVFVRRFAQSRVAIRDGQTIVIGGLMQDQLTKSVDKVPLLGDIPGLGAIFRRTIEKKSKTELLIFLTPHVALEPDELKGMAEAEKAGTKVVQEAVQKGTFQEHLKGMEIGASTRPAVGESSTMRSPLILGGSSTRPSQGQTPAQPDKAANENDDNQ